MSNRSRQPKARKSNRPIRCAHCREIIKGGNVHVATLEMRDGRTAKLHWHENKILANPKAVEANQAPQYQPTCVQADEHYKDFLKAVHEGKDTKRIAELFAIYMQRGVVRFESKIKGGKRMRPKKPGGSTRQPNGLPQTPPAPEPKKVNAPRAKNYNEDNDRRAAQVPDPAPAVEPLPPEVIEEFASPLASKNLAICPLCGEKLNTEEEVLNHLCGEAPKGTKKVVVRLPIGNGFGVLKDEILKQCMVKSYADLLKDAMLWFANKSPSFTPGAFEPRNPKNSKAVAVRVRPETRDMLDTWAADLEASDGKKTSRSTLLQKMVAAYLEHWVRDPKVTRVFLGDPAKVPVKEIEITYNEGPHSHAGRKFSTFDAVNSALYVIGSRCPEDGSYYKTDIKVTWEDGTEWEAKMDLNPRSPWNLGMHILEHCTFFGGDAPPTGIEFARWARLRDTAGAEHLERCSTLPRLYALCDGDPQTEV